MVSISKNLKNLPPEERLKRLKELEKSKKDNLKKKKKEIEELEKQAKEEDELNLKELQEAEELIQESIEDLHEEEERVFEELHKLSKENPNKEITIDDLVENEKAEKVPDSVIYGKQLEDISQANNFYEVTNYQVVRAVENLAQKALYKGLTFQEQEGLKHLKDSLGRISDNSDYQDKDSSSYMSKLSKRLEDIDSHLQRATDYNQSDSDKRRKDQTFQNNYQS